MEGQGDYWAYYLTTPKSSHFPCGVLGLPQPRPLPPPSCSTPLCSITNPALRASGYPPKDPTPPCSLEDSALLQAVLAPIPHGCIVHSLNGPVNGLEDILLQALGGGEKGRQLDLGAK